MTDHTGLDPFQNRWCAGVTYEAGKSPFLPDSITAYRSREQAEMYWSIYEREQNCGRPFNVAPSYWKAEGDVVAEDGFGVRCSKLTLLEAIPRINIIHHPRRVAIALSLAVEVFQEPVWKKWAEAFISGKDRSEKAARVAKSRLLKMQLGVAAKSWVEKRDIVLKFSPRDRLTLSAAAAFSATEAAVALAALDFGSYLEPTELCAVKVRSVEQKKYGVLGNKHFYVKLEKAIEDSSLIECNFYQTQGA